MDISLLMTYAEKITEEKLREHDRESRGLRLKVVDSPIKGMVDMASIMVVKSK